MLNQMRIATRLPRFGFALFLWPPMWTALLAGQAAADSRTEIAPPGPCAEPRETTAYVAPKSAATSAFDVVGPVQNLFDPIDVAAPPKGPSDLLPGPPPSKPPDRPNACDSPGTGCGINSPIVSQNPPIIPGVRPQP